MLLFLKKKIIHKTSLLILLNKNKSRWSVCENKWIWLRYIENTLFISKHKTHMTFLKKLKKQNESLIIMYFAYNYILYYK